MRNSDANMLRRIFCVSVYIISQLLECLKYENLYESYFIFITENDIMSAKEKEAAAKHDGRVQKHGFVSAGLKKGNYDIIKIKHERYKGRHKQWEYI